MKIGIQFTKNVEKYAKILRDIQSEIQTDQVLEFIHITDEESLHQHLPKLDVLACYRMSPESFTHISTSLHWIHFGAAGIEHSLFPELLKSDIAITNARGIHAGPVSEFVLGTILYFAKRFQDFQQFKTDQQWKQWDIAKRMVQLSGKTAGIIGYGRIGKAVAKRLTAMGMNIIALQRNLENKNILSPKQLNELLTQSDFVVITCPLTPETRGWIDDFALSQMKSTAYLINVSRGAIVNEEALIESLKSGGIAGAALDVFSTEPLSENSPFFELDNVLLSPHVSGNFPEYQHDVAIQFGQNLNRYLHHQLLINLIDKKLGY